MADKMMPTINMRSYKPDEKAINRALWGKDAPPTDEEKIQARKDLAEQFEKLRKLGEKKDK